MLASTYIEKNENVDLDKDLDSENHIDERSTEELKQKIQEVFLEQTKKDARLIGEMEMRKVSIRGRKPFHTVRGYPLEALVFNTAVGASMAQTAFTDSLFYGGRTDPVWMENLLNKITSPVGLFSFFCFVFFSGETNYLYSKLLLDGFVFERGFLKGYQIKALMPSELVNQRLKYLRKDWVFHGRWREAFYSPLPL